MSEIAALTARVEQLTQCWKIERARAEQAEKQQADDALQYDGMLREQKREIERLRAEFARFMDICGEGSARGRPVDLIDKQDWLRARAALAEKPQ